MTRSALAGLTALAGFALSAAPAKAEVDFAKDIKPILEQSCLKCHGPNKPKAGLRLDTREVTVEGSKGGEVVVIGKPEESILYERVTLPDGDELRMPPDGKALTKDQQAKISDWIKEGLKWPKEVTLKIPEGSLAPMEEVVDKGKPITPEEKAAVEKLKEEPGILAIRLAQNTNLLRVDFSLGSKKVTSEQLALLKQMPNLVELDLGGTDITDESMAHLKPLTGLRRLQLQKTKVTDAGLENIAGCVDLESLNLYATGVTDEGLVHLIDMPKLKKLYLWQSKVTKEGAGELVKLIPELDANLGFDPPEPKKEEPKK